MLLQLRVNFDQEKHLLVVPVIVVDVFQFQFQILNSNRVNYQDYLNGIEFVDGRLVVVVVVDFVRINLNKMMLNVREVLLETNSHSHFQMDLKKIFLKMKKKY